MSRIFISHSSKNDDVAIALKMWLTSEGWGGEDDIFLDIDPERGIAAGERWVKALEAAATRCEAVLFLVSEAWLSSKWCYDEYQLASKRDKKIFALLIEDVALERLPGGLTAQWQIVRLKGEPAQRFLTVHPLTQRQSPAYFAEAGLRSLKEGLRKAGLGAETFDLQPDPNDPTGWRAPYRGLEAFEPEDAAVFFGRSADIVRGMDALRGLASRPGPRLLVILGASGGGKSSFLRAGLWPRLLRDDAQWLPLRVIRAGRGGAIDGAEGLLASLEELHRRFALQASRADLRQRVATPDGFVDLLRELQQAAARRVLLTAPPYPLPVLCLDQAEEVFSADRERESERLLRLFRAGIDANAALLILTIRSDSYNRIQTAAAFADVAQTLFSLGPAPTGEIARIIREPAEILRRKAGHGSPIFDPAVVVRLQDEMVGEIDALPLLAFALQRLMREHAAAATIGLNELEATGGVAGAIEWAAEAALADAGLGRDRDAQRAALRRLFIPRLARVDRESKAFQRRVSRLGDLTKDLLPLARALTDRRLLIVKSAERGTDEADEATLEVAHEALLRRWPTLAELLSADRDALLLLDGVLNASADWQKADATKKQDYLAHRGSRLTDAIALASRGSDWAREIAPAQAYLSMCRKAEAAAKGRARRVQAAAYAGLLAVILGLVAWINQAAIGQQWHWWTVERPYRAKEFLPFILPEAAERELKPLEAFKECARDCPEMIAIPPGAFKMGSPDDEVGRASNEGPQHDVTIAMPFAVAKFDVTFADWDACVKLGGCPEASDYNHWGHGRQPVINVSWDDAQLYVGWLSKMTGRPYRLLSEAEWEYSARARTTTPYYWGNSIGKNNADCNRCGSQWDGKQPAPVGSFAPNDFGLNDMAGNVWQWVSDCVNPNYDGAPNDGSAWTTGDCGAHMVRGGSWFEAPVYVRAAYHVRVTTGRRDYNLGFRVARSLNHQ